MADLPTWTSESTGSDVAATFSEKIHGKTILIVGVSPQSLGSATAEAYAAHSPALLILASRTMSNLQTVAESLPSSCRVELVTIDLSDYASMRKAASQITSLTPRIDILINNAAVVTESRTLSATAQHELQFATTFLGPFLLTNLLMPLLLKSASQPTSATAPSTRIINVTSAGHVLSPIRFSDPHFHLPMASIPESERPASWLPPIIFPKDGGTYAPFAAYGQSKSANILFSVELNKRLFEQGRQNVVSFAVHPGSVETNLSRHLGPESKELVEGTAKATGWMSMGQGCVGMLVAGLDPRLVEDGRLSEGGEGVYLNGWRVDIKGVAKHAVDKEAASRLWALAERELGVKCDGFGEVVEGSVEHGTTKDGLLKGDKVVSEVKEVKI